MIVLAGSYRVRPDQLERAKAEYLDWLVELSRSEAGMIRYEIGGDLREPGKIVCLAILKDAEALAAHRQAHTAKWDDFTKKFEVSDWDILHIDGARSKTADPHEDALAAD